MTIRNKFSIIGITALLIGFAVIFFSRQNNQDGKVFIHAVPVQTVDGWGYHIMADEKIYISQEFIPGMTGKQGFKTSKDAMLVGDLVVKRIGAGLPPVITIKDLSDLGLAKDTISH